MTPFSFPDHKGTFVYLVFHKKKKVKMVEIKFGTTKVTKSTVNKYMAIPFLATGL